MCNMMTEETVYKTYDSIVSTVMMNILVERERCGKFLLYDFKGNNGAEKLYFNVAAIASDLRKEPIYLDMPLIDYIKFWLKRHKSRKNLRWFGPISKRKLADEHKTSVYILMDFIREQLNFDEKIYDDINNEYYGWVD